MKRMMLAVLGFVVLGSLSLAGQGVAKPGSTPKASQTLHAKAIRISGRVSEDGTKFIDTNQNIWVVTNLETLKGYEGLDAVLRAYIGKDADTIQVISIKRQVTYTANSGDSAFRR
jgi:hypothetical protein